MTWKFSDSSNLERWSELFGAIIFYSILLMTFTVPAAIIISWGRPRLRNFIFCIYLLILSIIIASFILDAALL